jgi:hypothetical protein
MPYVKIQLQITGNNGAEDANDRLNNMSLSEEIQVVIDGHTYPAEILDYEMKK